MYQALSNHFPGIQMIQETNKISKLSFRKVVFEYRLKVLLLDLYDSKPYFLISTSFFLQSIIPDCPTYKSFHILVKIQISRLYTTASGSSYRGSRMENLRHTSAENQCITILGLLNPIKVLLCCLHVISNI